MANGVESVSLSPFEGENHIGSASMGTTASNNLVLPSFSSLKHLAEFERQLSHAGLYRGIGQKLIKGVHASQTLTDFATRLAPIADQAYSLRRLDVVGAAAQLLLNLPLSREWESAGHYYQALALNQGGRGDTVRAGSLFERVADCASSPYRARAMLALGTNSIAVGDHKTAISFYRELTQVGARSHSFEPLTFCIASRMTAVIRGINGDHRGALADLERMYPLATMARSVRPYAYYDYLNTLAVELAEVGRLDQARRAAEIALSSPFAVAYSEWRQTFDEIARKQQQCASRSAVAVREHVGGTRTAEECVGETSNLLRLPLAQHPTSAALVDQRPQGTRARVLNFQQWKTAIKASSRATPEGVTAEQRSPMTTGEKLIRLLDLISQDETDDETIDRILEAVEQIVPNRRGEKVD